MWQRNIIFFSLVLSLFLHLLPASFFSLKVEEPRVPVVYSWLDILRKDDLYEKRAKVSEWQKYTISLDGVRKRYFSSALAPQEEWYPLHAKPLHPSFPTRSHFQEPTNHLYLWEKKLLFPSGKEEVIPYQIFVSPYGKVIFSFPCKFPLDSEEGLVHQEYLREASLFLKDKFFWTKLEGVVK
ncbi:MAG: hypothetical protein JSW40_02310 [Candidatus Omnitrophota bacterium]|nr:MAG: hypothetical protein JSW40_02310 [Candidatus Omnitrophota bacterium]